MRRKASSLALIVAMTASMAEADPATSQGAQQIVDGYVAIFGRQIVDQGILTVDPHGDSYNVTWHIRHALELARTTPAMVQMGDISYAITPGAGGAWRVTANAFPSIVFDTPTNNGRMSGKIGLTGMDVDSSYDPAKPVPFNSRTVIGDIVADLRILNAGKVIPFRIEESGVQFDMTQTTTDVGADLALHETLRSVVEKMSVPIETQPNAKIDMTFKVGAASADGTIDQFRTRQALAAWQFLAAHKNQPKDQAWAAALKTILADGLPGWQKMNLTADLSDLEFDMSLAKAHIKDLRETFDLPGFTPVASGGFGLKIDEFNLQSPLLPQGFESLLPLSLDVGVSLKMTGLDEIAKVALADPGFMFDSDVSPEGQAKIRQIVENGDPTFVLAPGYLRIPLIDLAYQGEVKVSPNSAFKAHAVVSADTLDKIMAFIKPFVVLSPEVAKSALAVSAAKGMAKTGSDGRLVWEIDMAGPPGQLTVNGVPIPLGR